MAGMSIQEAADILYKEARLLDEKRFDEWLALFTDDARYWVPCNRDDGDPNREISIIYDDRQTMRDRVSRLQSGVAHAQSPFSKTRRLITNIDVEKAGDGEAIVFSNFVIYELRRSKQNAFAGHYEHHLRQENDGWKIGFKKAALINNDEVIDSLTFLV